MSKPCEDNGLGFSDRSKHCWPAKAVHLKCCFRLLWEQHVYWTRIVIMGIAFDLPDLEASTNRLLRNPSDFAKVLSNFYGRAAAAEFERLLTDHLTIAAELVTAAKAGNTKETENAEKRWYRNANDIASFMARINPCWDYEQMKAMWFEHLALTKDEAVAILNKRYKRSVEIFDQIERQALEMADDFTNGILCQFGR